MAIKPPGEPGSRAVASRETMIDRIKAGVDARTDQAVLISARTDAASSLGLDEAIERANLYAEAGADLLFVQSLRSQAQAERLASELDRKLPLVIHLPDAPAQSAFDLAKLAVAGFAYGLLPSLLVSAAAHAIAAQVGCSESVDLQTLLRSG